MRSEDQLSQFVVNFHRERVPHDALSVIKRVLLTTIATVVTGAGEERCEILQKKALGTRGKAGGDSVCFR